MNPRPGGRTAAAASLIVFTFVLGASSAQRSPDDNEAPDLARRFGPLTRLIGRWEGSGSGVGGPASVTYHVRPVISNRFIQWDVESIGEPRDDGAPGDVHRDIAMISYDVERDRHVMRQFLSEGYVNTYVLHPAADDTSPLHFETISVEGLPTGWRARLNYFFRNDDAMTWTLYLGPPDQDFFECRTGSLQRVGSEP